MTEQEKDQATLAERVEGLAAKAAPIVTDTTGNYPAEITGTRVIGFIVPGGDSLINGIEGMLALAELHSLVPEILTALRARKEG